MALVGNIRDFGLSDFLYLVDRGYKTGCLHLRRGDDSASLYFDKGKLVTAAHANRQIQVTDLLMRKGKLTAQQVQEATKRLNGSLNLSQLLIDRNYISR